MRPFFLRQLADPDLISKLGDSEDGGALSFLIEAMISREAGKFGAEVDSLLSAAERTHFVRTMMLEVARDLADNQTIAISESSLSWLVELSLPKQVPKSTEFLLKNRAPYLGFLTVDDRPRHFRFYHEKFSDYFLSRVIITTIAKGEVPKFVSRNLFGSSFLETFSAVLGSQGLVKECQAFHAGALDLLARIASQDRSRKNIAAFLISSLHLASSSDTVMVIKDVEVDEARIVGTSIKSEIRDSVISQLDARDADLIELFFVNCEIYTLIVNEDTIVRDDSFTPHRLVVVSRGQQEVLSDNASIRSWLL